MYVNMPGLVEEPKAIKDNERLARISEGVHERKVCSQPLEVLLNWHQ